MYGYMKPVRAVRRGVINAEIEKVFGVVNIIIMPNFRCLNILEINEMEKLRFKHSYNHWHIIIISTPVVQAKGKIETWQRFLPRKDALRKKGMSELHTSSFEYFSIKLLVKICLKRDFELSGRDGRVVTKLFKEIWVGWVIEKSQVGKAQELGETSSSVSSLLSGSIEHVRVRFWVPSPSQAFVVLTHGSFGIQALFKRYDYSKKLLV